jgi:hypothetical protein
MLGTYVFGTYVFGTYVFGAYVFGTYAFGTCDVCDEPSSAPNRLAEWRSRL